MTASCNNVMFFLSPFETKESLIFVLIPYRYNLYKAILLNGLLLIFLLLPRLFSNVHANMGGAT